MFLNLSWSTQQQISSGGGRRGRPERGRRHSNRGRWRTGGRRKSGGNTQEEGVTEKRPRTEKSGTETEVVGGQARPPQSRYKKGHITNINLTDFEEEAIVEFVKDQEELYDKTNEHLKDKARKQCLMEHLTNSHKLFVKVCKTWFDLQRRRYVELTQSKSGQAPKEMMEHQNWTQDKFGFLKLHIRCKGLSKLSAFKSQARGASASAATAHDISRALSDTDSIEISMHHFTASTSHKPNCSLRALFG